MQNQTSPLILTFGATDPVGAIGIQADLASFAAMGCHGLSAVTSILISDTSGIEDIQVIDSDWVTDQARLVLEDMVAAAIKVGIIGSMENVTAIAEIVSDYPDVPFILDPFASNLPDQGSDSEELLFAIRELLIPQTDLLLVSGIELARFAETWRGPVEGDTVASDALHLTSLGCEYVFVTGISSTLHDVTNALFDQSGMVRSDSWPRQSGSFSGAGTTLSATIAALLANGLDVPEAVAEAQEFNAASIAHAQRLGMGKLVPDRYFWSREPNESE